MKNNGIKRNILIMKTIMTIFIGILFMLGSCSKTPGTCIYKEIEKEKNNCLDKVYEYEFNGETVYLFVPAGCPDAMYILYNENCDFVCSPSGGLSGNGDGRCLEFYNKAVNEKLIWSK
jgi:uncharacterized protein DUF6970